MKLKHWRKAKGLTLQAVADKIEVHKESVRRYELPADDPEWQLPSRAAIRRIYRLTGGQVTPFDMLQIRPRQQAAA